ncbi:MAG: hypothetical protein IJI98_06065 [Methanosphaera sp.]|nr:hypothetical protein [Methanosphaera sp.]
MTDYIIKENINNLNSKQRFSTDPFLSKLINILVNNKEGSNIHEYVRDMFYFKSIEEYQRYLPHVLIAYEESYELVMKIYNLFMEWNVFDKYNLGELRGNYLEMLLFEYIKENHYDANVYREVNVLIGDYKSHVWDVVLESEDYISLFESKFSSKVLKRHHINQMIGLFNKLPESEIYLVAYENKEVLTDSLDELQEETSKTKYDNIIKNFNLISIENFNQHDLP